MSLTIAPELHRDLAQVAGALDDAGEVALVTSAGSRVSLPGELRQLLSAAVHSLCDGHEVIVAAKDAVVTAQEAADFLGVSRPTLIRILGLGEIAYERPNSHRRIRLADLVAYQQRREVSRAALDGLLASSVDLDEYDTGEFVRTR
jgi:excisionase family DNA binding protein